MTSILLHTSSPTIANKIPNVPRQPAKQRRNLKKEEVLTIQVKEK